jgi:hypothetical protein
MRKLFAAICGASLMAGAACAQDADHLRDFRDKLIWKGPLMKTALSALFNEAINSPTEWGRGPEGFAKRAGNSFAQRTVKASVELAVSPLTHEDLHFRRSGEGSVWTRVKHAVLGTFWVPRDDGSMGYTLAAGRIAGDLAAGQASRIWMPARVANFGAGVRTGAGGLALDVGSDLVREFWPRKRQHCRTAASCPPTVPISSASPLSH